MSLRHKHTPGSHGAWSESAVGLAQVQTNPELVYTASRYPRDMKPMSGLLPAKVISMPQQGGRHSDVRDVFLGLGAAEKCVVLQSLSTLWTFIKLIC